MRTPQQNLISSVNVGTTTPVTRAMVHQRTRELTRIAGREPQHVLQADYEQAKRELTGEVDGERQQAVLDASLERESVRDPRLEMIAVTA